MKNIAITGGTDGIGAALARHHLRAGDPVSIVGRNPRKFAALVNALDADGVPGVRQRARFIRADLTLLAETQRAVREIAEAYEHLDALVLAASYVRQERHLTSEGREASWVLFFVSKYLLVTGLSMRLQAAAQPIIVNTAVPGTRADAITFDDLEGARGFTLNASNAQQRRANEVLGILPTRSGIPYATWGPKFLVKTSFAGEVRGAMKFALGVLPKLIGEAPESAAASITALITSPPEGRTAYRGTRTAKITETADDEVEIARLEESVAAYLTELSG